MVCYWPVLSFICILQGYKEPTMNIMGKSMACIHHNRTRIKYNKIWHISMEPILRGPVTRKMILYIILLRNYLEPWSYYVGAGHLSPDWRDVLCRFQSIWCDSCFGSAYRPVDSHHISQWRGTLMFSLICTWANSWANNRDTGDLRRHCIHYDVTVMM